jgi:lipopolysaccharide/colanic/teichoic acid biosynthesis glycosyltransferase
MNKRFFDIVVACIAIVLFLPVMLLVSAVIKATSRGPVIFQQTRVGQNLRPFLIFKFRTMVADAKQKSLLITPATDSRITACGRIFRKLKFDELPQLFNVLKGDMSIVGPRPEVPKYVFEYQNDFEQILAVRPGITDLASVRFRNESEILSASDNPEQVYRNKILPEKIKLAKQYQEEHNMLLDIRIIWKTLIAILFPNSIETSTL